MYCLSMLELFIICVLRKPDRRKTIMGGISTERLFLQRKADEYER